MDLAIAFSRPIASDGGAVERVVVAPSDAAGPRVFGQFDLCEEPDGTLLPIGCSGATGPSAQLSVDGTQYLVLRDRDGWSCALAGSTGTPVPEDVREQIRAVMDAVVAAYQVDEGVQSRAVLRLRRALDAAVFERSEAQEAVHQAREWVTSATAKVQEASHALEACLAAASRQVVPR